MVDDEGGEARAGEASRKYHDVGYFMGGGEEEDRKKN